MSRIQQNHPLKLFIEYHLPSSSQHRPCYKNSCRSCSFLTNRHHSVSLKQKINPNLTHHHPQHSHSFHLQHHHLNSTGPDSTTPSIRPHNFIPNFDLGLSPSTITYNNSQPPPHNQTSWWQCSSKPIQSDRPSFNLQKPSKNYKLRLKDERSQSFQNYTSQLSNLLRISSSSPSTLSLLKLLDRNLQDILNDINFRQDFKIIWSDLSSIEEASKDDRVKFQVIEYQRKSIEILLNTLISAVSTCSSASLDQNFSIASQDFDIKISIFNQVIDFLIFTNPPQHPNRVISILGLDPIEGWRNLVKQHLRIRTLKALVAFINHFNPNLSTWWSSELARAQDDPTKLNRLAHLGIFLISALSKQGSAWKALQLFWMMDKLPQSDPALNAWESFQPISHPRRATVALGLADALISRKKIDYADLVLETVSVGEWIGATIYRRYLLNMLTVKGAQAEVSSVEKIGMAYERAWSDSDDITDSVAGRNKRAREFHAQDPRIPAARAKIEALGVLGETRSAIEKFQATISAVPSNYSAPSQLPDLYAEMMRVHLKADDPGSIKKLLTRMATAPDSYGTNQPDQRHYNMLLQAYAARADIEGCSSVLDQLLAAGISPDVYTYGNIALLFANLGEPEFIREVIEALSKTEKPNRSIRPNRELWNILLDAYIESGDWSRAAKLLEYLERIDQRTKQSDVVTNGSVLKALVVSGCPTDVVLETFKSMYNFHTGLAADAKSSNFLLLSICDSGMMDLAEAMFYSLLKDSAGQSEQPGKRAWDPIKPNVYMFGIMISAFLRMRKYDSAQRYLREMRRSGIRPNLVIYSMLTKAYAASKSAGMKTYSWEESDDGAEEEKMSQDGTWVAYEMASRFRRELLDNEAHLKGRVDEKLADKHAPDQSHWGELPIIRKRLSHRLLGPIIQSYAKSARPAKALEMLRELVSSLGSDYNTIGSDGKPIDIDIFTMLMDAYRRAQDPVGVIEVWKEIFRIATQKNDSLDASEKLLNKVIKLIETDGSCQPEEEQIMSKDRGLRNERRQGRQANKLCLPLSIYTDCLSRHGYHEEVATSWQEVQESGFGFDAANWNELCAAMFRSGNHRMGWWITERIFFTSEPVVQDDYHPEIELQIDQKEDSKWAQVIHQTTGFRSVRAAQGLEGTRLDGAMKVESPLRPPNRTSIQKTRRFDDQIAVRRSFQSLLSGSMDSRNEDIDVTHDTRLRWSQQLDHISQVRRDLEWKPYEKVSRMLHGSMWRECTDVIVKKWEQEERQSYQVGDDNDHKDRQELGKIKMEVDRSGRIEEGMHQCVQEIIDGYELRYPKTIAHVLAMNDSLDIPTSLSEKDLYSWNKFDFISRVTKRTIKRILE